MNKEQTTKACPKFSIVEDDTARIEFITEHITQTPNICSGDPCVKGTRLRVSDILSRLYASKFSTKELLEDYEGILTAEDICACLLYCASEMIK
jgi:uncharacterized protein (DUF433 family)